jgi:hypothetical protein
MATTITKHTAVTAQPTVTPQVAPQGYDLKKARSRADSESSACLDDSAEKAPATGARVEGLDREASMARPWLLGSVRRYNSDMEKQPTKQDLHSWAVYHIKCTPAKLVGTVYDQPDAESAIKQAIMEYDVPPTSAAH